MTYVVDVFLLAAGLFLGWLIPAPKFVSNAETAVETDVNNLVTGVKKDVSVVTSATSELKNL